DTFSLIISEIRGAYPDRYTDMQASVAYPTNRRQKCDARISTLGQDLYIEGKLLRLKGDNGLPNDNMLMHILSAYPHHRSALTDCVKLARSNFDGHKVIVIVGYEYADLPLEPAVEAFEVLAARLVKLGTRSEAEFAHLCHPVHQAGKVLAWTVS